MDSTDHLSPVRLPQELVDNIIDHFYDEHDALRTCALVCSAWLPTSRRHLFHKISLKATSAQTRLAVPQERCQRLYKTLQRNPALIAYVRELEICEGSPLHSYNSEVQGSTTWVTTERALAALFRMLTHVERLDFAAMAPLHWALLPPTFVAALCSLLALPSLAYLRLHSFLFPSLAEFSRVLAPCKNLRAVALALMNVSSDHGAAHALQAPADGQRAPLEVLTLDFVTFPHLDQWLLDPPALPSIRHLRELRVAHHHDAQSIERLLQAVGGSLERLHLKPGSWTVTLFDLAHNPGLRSIRLTLDDPDTAIDWVTTILESVQDGTALSDIGLEFYAAPKRIHGWEALDELFMKPAFAGLKTVEIGLFAIPGHPDFTAVKEALHQLDSRGIVRWFQLALKNEKSIRRLTPRISRYES